MVKKVIDQGMQTTLEQGLALEVNAFSQLFNSQDMKEGTAAFLAKRAAVFKGE
jgi:enoyl-CoA hydratase/carnithine racemase